MNNGKMSCFRLKPKTLKQLSEISTLWGVNKTKVIEIMVDTFANTTIEVKVNKVSENETEVL